MYTCIGMGTEQIQDGEGMGSEQVQNRHRTEMKRKWNGYGTIQNW